MLVRVHGGSGAGDRRYALVVDSLLGNREIVSKAGGAQVSSVPGISGATSLADGRAVLILDLAELAQDAARRALRAAVEDRSAERRVGKECVSTCRCRWWQNH